MAKETVNSDPILIVTCTPVGATGTIRLYQGNELLQEEQVDTDLSKITQFYIDPMLEYTLVFEGGDPLCRVEILCPAAE
ncbi:hypothetical protein CCP3SC1_270007 [Gammaproteobacteria bacterium]